MFDFNEKKKQKIENCLAQLSTLDRQILSVPYFTRMEISSLIKFCSQISFREANSITATGVSQDFSVCFPAPKTGAMRKCINHFNVMFSVSGIQQYFSKPVCFNDIAAQYYKKGSNGIGIHRDKLRYRGLVLIICLSGRSELFTADNREGEGAQIIDDTPGRLVMMSGPGFKYLSDAKSRPLHGVRNIIEERLSLGLRCDSEKSNFD